MSEKVLFICGRNSGRSQIAAAYLDQLGQGQYAVQSAGLEPAEAVNPLVIEVMKEEGMDLSDAKPSSAFDLVKTGELFSYVITVCDKQSDSQCPIFPGIQRRENWPFPDPETVSGSDEDKREQVRAIRDAIKSKLIDYFSLAG